MKRLITGLATIALAFGGLGLAGLDACTAQAACTPDTGCYAAATTQIIGAQGIPCISIGVGRTRARAMFPRARIT